MVTTEHPHRILIVGNQTDRRHQVAEWLASGYAVAEAASAIEGLVAVVQMQPALVLLDVPWTDGPDFIREALVIDPNLGVVVLADGADIGIVMRSLRAGALDCLTAPLGQADLEVQVRRALERRHATAEDRVPQHALKQHGARAMTGREDVPQRQEDLTVRVLESLAFALEARSPYLQGHATRVADLGATIAAQLRLADTEVETVRLAGRLRDLGMIGIRDEVLNKQGPLTLAEHAHVREHVTIGVQILAPLQSLAQVTEIVRSHHERWDGSGYPDGLDGPAIPVAARILHTADVFDALTSTRPYQKTMSREGAVDRIRQLAGQAFDPLVVDALVWAVLKRHTLEFVPDATMPTGVLESLSE